MSTEALTRIMACPLAVEARGSSIRVVIAADKYSVAHIAEGINDREEYAQLFGAAPAMLAALRRASSFIICNGYDAQDQALLNEVSAAITKAEGRS